MVSVENSGSPRASRSRSGTPEVDADMSQLNNSLTVDDSKRGLSPTPPVDDSTKKENGTNPREEETKDPTETTDEAAKGLTGEPEAIRIRSPSRSRSRSRSTSRSRSRSNSRSRRRRDSRDRRSDKHRSRRSHRSRSYSRSRSPRQRSRSRGSYRRRRDSREYRRRRSPRSNSRSRSPSPYHRRLNPSPCRVIGIFGLSFQTDDRDLKRVFEKYGRIDKVKLVTDPRTGRSRGFAFVYMSEVEDAEEAKERVHGSVIDGNHVRCEYSISNREHHPTPGVYMGRRTARYDERSRSRSRSYERRRRSYSNDRY